ncbi:MAG: transcriptional repressor LexA [Spirochaetaceae bacterium]|nr:transcriptional repressor LexA [Spirochaetaceae bacterium]
MKELTARQQQVLDFIRNYIEQNSFPPTVRETARAFHISIKGAYDHLKALEKKGLIKTRDRRSRSIELVSGCPGDSAVAQIPLIGEIAAGRPIFAEENFERVIQIPAEMLNSTRPHFALRVKGDSMIGAGIMSGDLAIIEQTDSARNGEIIVALLDDAATLKRYFKEQNRIRLQAENPHYPPLYTQDLRILGRLTGIVRRY